VGVKVVAVVVAVVVGVVEPQSVVLTGHTLPWITETQKVWSRTLQGPAVESVQPSQSGIESQSRKLGGHVCVDGFVYAVQCPFVSKIHGPVLLTQRFSPRSPRHEDPCATAVPGNNAIIGAMRNDCYGQCV
jgi:hypothetical protein